MAQVNLNNLGASGPLDAIGQLTALVSLQLSQNSFAGWALPRCAALVSRFPGMQACRCCKTSELLLNVLMRQAHSQPVPGAACLTSLPLSSRTTSFLVGRTVP